MAPYCNVVTNGNIRNGLLERMPPIDVKDATTAPPTNQQDLEAPAKETSKLAPVVTSQVCSVISLAIIVTMATGRATFIAGHYIKRCFSIHGNCAASWRQHTNGFVGDGPRADTYSWTATPTCNAAATPTNGDRIVRLTGRYVTASKPPS